MKENEVICPKCGKDLSTFNSMDFEDKLVLGLDNPIVQNRMFIIEVIGRKKIGKAVPKLCRMLSEERDPYELLEIAKALFNIGTKEAINCLKDHPSLGESILLKYLL